MSVERLSRGDGHRPVVPVSSRCARRHARVAEWNCAYRSDATRVAQGQACWLLRRAAGVPVGGRRAGRLRRTHLARRARHVQDGGYVRGGVRREDAVPLRDLRRRRRGRTPLPSRGRHPGEWTQPHRAGSGVRLLLRARRLCALRRRVRDGDAQLQPGDRLHRLRHQRPSLLRAPLSRRRARGVQASGGTGRPGWWRARRGRGGAGRADAAQAGAHARRSRRASARHQSRLDRPGGRPRALPRAVHPPRHRAAARRHRGHHRGGAGDRRRARLPGAGAPVVRARWSRHADRLRRREPRHRDGGARRRGQSRTRRWPLGRPPGAGRPVPRGRGGGRRRRHPRRHRRVDHRRGDGAHRGGRGALGRLRVRDPAPDVVGRHGRPHRDPDARPRRCARRARPAERAVRGEGRRALRDRGQPAAPAGRCRS